ncbi:MAG: YcgN family cysteine cluster protein [Gammaproteobacteria bacterium]|nr:YcgN family cysteine cluster protein [Gammaproteobacteria bacterium]
MSTPFWENTALEDMTPEQWESLCDGCGRCCAVKLQDNETGKVHYTRAACRLLDPHSCRCTNYPQRAQLVPDCAILNPEQARSYEWLPDTCAYRILAKGGKLHWWHPLVSGSTETVHEAGISVRGQLISEEHIHASEIPEMIIDWQKLSKNEKT